MTIRMALKKIREEAPETEITFQIIRKNRKSTPIRYWAIYDLAKLKNLEWDSAKRLYNRHFARLCTIFRVPPIG